MIAIHKPSGSRTQRLFVLANFIYTISFNPHNSRPEALLLPTAKLRELGFRKVDMPSPKSETIPGFTYGHKARKWDGVQTLTLKSGLFPQIHVQGWKHETGLDCYRRTQIP